MNGRQYLFSTKCLLEFVLGKYATPFQMKTKEKRLLQKQVSAKPNVGLKQYQHLLEKKTIGEEATTFRHELDFEENERGKLFQIHKSYNTCLQQKPGVAKCRQKRAMLQQVNLQF